MVANHISVRVPGEVLFKPTGMRRRGVLEWPALLKRLDGIDPSYRD